MRTYSFTWPVLKVSSLKRLLAAITVALVAFAIAVLQPFGNSPDYEQYEIIFQGVRVDWFSFMRESRYEPGFIAVVGVLSKIFDADILIYGMLVFAAIAAKTTFLAKISFDHYFWLAIIFYLFRFFPVHELTQLRVALASSIMIYAAFQVWGPSIRKGIAASLLAVAFHFSSLMISPFLLLVRRDRQFTILSAIVVFLGLAAISQLAIAILGENMAVIQMHQQEGFDTRSVNPVSPAFYAEFFIILFSLFCWRDLTGTMQRVVAIELIGFAVLYALIEFPVIAVRGREFFSVLWVMFIAQSGTCARHIRLATYIFVLASIVWALYLYFYLDFFW